MDRKGIIAIALAIIVLLGWSQYYSRQVEAYTKARQEQEAKAVAARKAAEAAAAPLTPEAPAPASPSVAGQSAPAGTPSTPAVEVKTEKITTPAVAFSFTNVGGGVAVATLLHHQAEAGAPVELNQFGPLPIGAVSETAGEMAALPFSMTADAAAGVVTFERTDATRQLQMVKKFTLPKAGAEQEYLSHLEVSFTNHGAADVKLPGLYVYTGSAAPVHQKDLPTNVGFGWQHDGKFTFKDSGSFSSGGMLGMGRTDQPIFQDSSGGAEWAGVTDQYFTTIVTPQERKGSGIWAHRFAVEKSKIGAPVPNAPPAPSDGNSPMVKLVEGAVAMPAFTVAPGKTETFKFEVYTGPREYRRLVNLGGGQDAIMAFGTFRVVCKVLLNTMNWLHARLGNYGVAIMVLTLIIRGVMWPLQNKGTQSMKKMQALGPEMTALKEKYRDDPQRMSQEQMKLYKTYNINPLAGCLPMVVQIPVFFGFYSMLGKAVELRNSDHFLWVKDLSQPDTVANPFGYPLNVLPLIMMATMVGQMKLSPKAADPTQQRIQMFIPIVFIAFCYNYASALALYLSVQNIFSIAQLYLTRNQTTAVLQKPPSTSKKKRF